MCLDRGKVKAGEALEEDFIVSGLGRRGRASRIRLRAGLASGILTSGTRCLCQQRRKGSPACTRRRHKKRVEGGTCCSRRVLLRPPDVGTSSEQRSEQRAGAAG